MNTILIIVESPTKARTIKKFLPHNFIIEACMGHVRDLPQKAQDIPKAYKQEEWAKLGIHVDNNFEPLYVTLPGKNKIIQNLRKIAKTVDMIYLATDEDREGESISWHLSQLLKTKKPLYRMVFHEITNTAIAHALNNLRQIDMNLVKAQETRRILDRLFGYTLSPLIWKKIAYGLSAGRVQSPGLLLIVEREYDRINFISSNFKQLKIELHKDATPFTINLIQYTNQKIAHSKDFNQNGHIVSKNTILLSDELIQDITHNAPHHQWRVSHIAQKQFNSRPPAPFITSTLQQAANNRLHLSAKETMRTAQNLYEQGFITYMRTDSPHLSQEAITRIRHTIKKLWGNDFVPAKPNLYKAKTNNAQEAHEAIRPTSDFIEPIKTNLTGIALRLYELIWQRTLASQMSDSIKNSTTIEFQYNEALFHAKGTHIIFHGYLQAYVDDKKKNDEQILPHLQKDDLCQFENIHVNTHTTKPPPRYSEAGLIQRLEKEGIGRPSTYASIISTLYDRGYAYRQETSLIPTFVGIAVANFLDTNFHEHIKYNFTSVLETTLDLIATGEYNYLHYLREFYNGKNGLLQQVQEREKISPEQSRKLHTPHLPQTITVHVGRYGPYLIAHADDSDKSKEIHISIPTDIAPADLTMEHITQYIDIQRRGPEPLGIDPATNNPVFCLMGRFGPYVQIGTATEENPKPHRVSVPKDTNIHNVTLADALKWLSLPRTLGIHPTSTHPIIANNGRFGPYIEHNGIYRSVKKDDNVYTISLERALELLEKETTKSKGVVLGTYNKKKLQLSQGKYGYYLKWGTKNITLPENWKTNTHIETELTFTIATAIIAEKTKSSKSN